ncbi:MAG: hypothetical protein GY714_31875 [Desulfobacterales bacterium]|nr:hypothetical protein [Desulfobacterales bacterium]
MKKIIFIIAVFCILLPTIATAAFTGKHKIIELKAQKEGIYFKLEGFTNNDETIKCDVNGFWMPESKEVGSNYNARVAFLLSAFSTSKKVKISYYRCINNYIEVSSVVLQP